MKAEICPVCSGRGKYKPICMTTDAATKTCHGCGGSGWVSVPEDHAYWPPKIVKDVMTK